MIREACGIFGIAYHAEAAEMARLGLFALQHRGQESAGIFLKRQGVCECRKGMGLVGDVFSKLPREWWKTPGQTMAIGHVRYSTSGSSSVVNAQPFAVEFDRWHLALAHNGTLSDAGHWRRFRVRNELVCAFERLWGIWQDQNIAVVAAIFCIGAGVSISRQDNGALSGGLQAAAAPQLGIEYAVPDPDDVAGVDRSVARLRG
ncbi:MAG: class II glutamine amidotransferase [Victivallales bacterium]|nr:class II glutamine amidotransferase [Victivallales bacterium]